jgi:pyruvate/2-oxoglutarate dehydrogenase complex dihydrolipoamide acyltransferase (E2) component
MPALSPTMTEGNIAKWNVKEGDSFSAGDVLLEIETDKASMDVEAQDDGIIAVITQGDGSKGIKVGMRIGVIAEPGDELSSLEIPAEDIPASPSPKEESSKSSLDAKSEPQAERSPISKPSSSESATPSAKGTSGKPKKQTYPLLPSVKHLIREQRLDASAVDKMIPSGPNNRLLKGDVLAYLGSISSSYPAELSTKIEKLSHLDLSNIKLAPLPPKAKPTEAEAKILGAIVKDLEIAVPISMKAVIEVQRRIQTTLGVFMPLSTFIARATDVANDNLPRSKIYQPTADELFNQVLGLDKTTSVNGVRGSFLPQITALSQASHSATPSKAIAKSIDIIDILSGKSISSISNIGSAKPLPGMTASVNVFSVKVPKGDEKRAQLFLERVKTVLEGEPGRLVL